MIIVIASVHVSTSRLTDFLDIFKDTLLEVRKERGCIEYFPTVDINSELTSQILEENVVTLIEKWEDMEALRVHLGSPHMLAYREKVKDIVESVHLKILKEA